MRALARLVLGWWIVAVWVGGAWAGSVIAVGTAPMGGQSGQQQALEAALMQAVLQRVAASAGMEAVAAHLTELSSSLLAKAQSFVKAYHLRASASTQNLSVVVVEVELDETAIDQALAEAGLKLDARRLGKVLMLVSEEVAPGRPPVFWWAASPPPAGLPAAVKEVVKTLGVDVVDPAKASALVPEDLRTPILSEAQGRRLGEIVGADVVVLGSVRCYPLVGDEQEAPPVLQMVAIEVSTGRTLAVQEVTGGVYPSTPPPEAAQELKMEVQKGLRELLAKACAARPPVEKAKRLELTVEGVTSLAQLTKLGQVLQGLGECVREARRTSVGEGKATYELQVSCTPSQLADTLLVQDYGDFMVNVLEVGDKGLRIRLVPKL